jgi:hypothetical protein
MTFSFSLGLADSPTLNAHRRKHQRGYGFAGVVHRSPYELRRRCISRLVLAGVDPVRIARRSGVPSIAPSATP